MVKFSFVQDTFGHCDIVLFISINRDEEVLLSSVGGVEIRSSTFGSKALRVQTNTQAEFISGKIS